jgi:HEAT repeat protein
MIPRRALIVAPLYDGQWLPQLAGRPLLVERLTKCLKERGNYDVKALNSIVKPSDFLLLMYELFSSDGELLFYFYGHGCLRPNGKGYFATSSARLYEEGIPMDEVISSAMTSNAREIVLILDCCHAGAATAVAGAATAVTNVAITGLAEQAVHQTAGRVLLAGCASHQNGWEVKADDEQKKIGAFSYHILKGLEGEARYGTNKVRGSMLGIYVTDVFKAWNQDPISRNSESGSRECIITSGFPAEIIQPPAPTLDSRQPMLIGVPFKPSQIFVGRSAEIDYLRTILTVGDKKVAVSATVEGLGGIGKTELVLQFLYQPDTLATYKTIIWLDGAGPLPPQWEKVAIELGVKNPGGEPTALVHAVEQELRKCGNSLIVLDNASEWGPVSHLIPKDIALLVTTRTQGFGGNSFRHRELRVLSDESATSFLVQMVPELEKDASLPQLVRTLEGHALALELAGWNIKYLGISAQKYIQRLSKHQADLTRALDATKYGKAVDACLSLTWHGLKLDTSRTLWRRASLFAPTSAHRELLRVSFAGDEETRYEIKRMMRYEFENGVPSTLLCNPEEFDEAYAELRAFHVLARVEGSNSERWAMHRLVRGYGRERLQRGEVAMHAMSLSEWLRHPTLPLESEIPHFVATIMDSARYVGEFKSLRGDRVIGREIAYRSVISEPEARFDSSAFIYYIRDQLQDPKALTMILEGLTDINEDVRIQSIRLLENIGPIPEVLDGLASSLDDPDPRVREMAGRTLAEHGGDKTISILSAAVQNPKPRASLASVKALGLMGKKAHSALKEGLRCDDPSVRIEAALLLCEQEQQEGCQILIDAIHSVPKREQGRLIDALGTAKDPKAVPTLVEFLSEEAHRVSAIRALGKIGDTSVYPQLVIFLKNEGDWGAGDAAKEVLIGEQNYATLKDALNSDDSATRIKAALLLCEQEQQEGCQILIDAIHSIPKQEQGRLIDALGTAKDPKAVPTLVEFLSEEEQRISAIRALGKIGDTSVYPQILELLKDDDDNIKCAVAECIEELKVSDGLAEIVARLVTQLGDQQVRGRFPELALEIAQRNNIAISLEITTGLLLKSDSWQLRQKCAISLGEAKNIEAVPALIEALADSDYDVRRETAKALGLIGDSRAETRLAEVASNDSDNRVKEAAATALKQIKGNKSNA